MSRRLQVVGVRAEFWARDTGAQRETVLFAPDYFTPANRLTPAVMARMMSTSGMDDGAVDFWPEVGGQVEVRDADTGETVWVYRGGRRFAPPVPVLDADTDAGNAARDALAEAEQRGQRPAAPPVNPADLDRVSEMGKVIAGFVLVERNRGVVVSVEAYRGHAGRLGSDTLADSAIEAAAVWLGMHDGLRDTGAPCGCYPPCEIPAPPAEPAPRPRRVRS